MNILETNKTSGFQKKNTDKYSVLYFHENMNHYLLTFKEQNDTMYVLRSTKSHCDVIVASRG